MGEARDRPPEITLWLKQWSAGNDDALEALLPVVYEELHRQAANYLRRERVGHTLQPTALINEVYIKLINQQHVDWQNRAHFFGIAAQGMRRILVDYARSRHRNKRGGNAENVPIDSEVLAISDTTSVDLIALDEALDRLAQLDQRQARIVELRFFSGMSVEETAEALGISSATVKNDWRTAKAWLFREING
ncbi:MAG TPA: sigma-70 family RNA polymerase sigma factor [Pyrinomonadaceae bacterium]|nr:sigma-70 family RNA polymerase sigma factor [Pyrinomonadaceae bacterium]